MPSSQVNPVQFFITNGNVLMLCSVIVHVTAAYKERHACFMHKDGVVMIEGQLLPVGGSNGP